MPSYDFRCTECGWEKTMTFPTVEKYSSHRANPRTKECPSCYKEAIVRIYTPVEFRFQGGKPSANR